MNRVLVTTVCVALLLVGSIEARPNGPTNKKPKQVVPPIDCDVRAGKINLQEFIVKCPSHCRETKQPVYGSGVFASISSICNAAIHSGVITNSGGKVIVSKMAGQSSYKGSPSHGVRSLSLPRWRESFMVSVGKPKKGVFYPATLDFTPPRPTSVTADLKEAGAPSATVLQPRPTVWGPTAIASRPISTTPEPTTTTAAPGPPSTTQLPTDKPQAAVHKVREAGNSHPYFASMGPAAASGAVLSAQGQGSASQAFRGRDTYERQVPPHTVSGMHRQDPMSPLRRQSGPSSVPVYNRVQAAAPERGQQTVLSNPGFMRRDWPPPSYMFPDWYSGPRAPTGAEMIHSSPDSGYTWTAVEPSETAERNPRPDMSEFERWHYSFGQFQPRAGEPDPNRNVPPDMTHTRFKPIDAWTAGGSPFDLGFSIPENDPLPVVPEPVSQGDPSCKVDVAFLMDGSWSIGRRRFQIQKDFLSAVSQAINVGVAGPMMGIVQYGDEPVTEFGLKAYPNPKDLKAAVDNIIQKGGLSNVGKALSYINKHYFTDGNGPDDKERQNVVEPNFVDKAVCRTNGFFSLPVSSWFSLRSAVQPLVKRVCDTDRLVCSKTCLNANDIAFVIDGSSSVGTGNFRTVLQFVANVTREFEISDTDTRVGAVQYTYEQRMEFGLGQHNSKAALLSAIRAIEYWSGGTSTGAAIKFASDKLFSQSKPNKRKIMIVITDGRSYDDVRAPALTLHSSGAIAYSVGIAWAAQEELEYIATDPDKDHSFFVEDFDNLHKVVPKIIHNICQEFNSQPRN
ncbi:hypothetical protein AGOR_G00099280 [Albula goreensis]|uniref:Vitrin n=1 Tax=Albula goreensis TaxID=1534307 RepID=A0A8T3DPI2_9TELE|nr:hypothetical protein AGOR_G00099280 [Albula goreensis]